MEEVFRSLTKVKVAVPQFKNALLKVKKSCTQNLKSKYSSISIKIYLKYKSTKVKVVIVQNGLFHNHISCYWTIIIDALMCLSL